MDEETGNNEDDNPKNAIQGGVIDRAADTMDDLVNTNRQIWVSDTKYRLKNDHKSLNIDQKRVVNKTLESVSSQKWLYQALEVEENLGSLLSLEDYFLSTLRKRTALL
ncbi:hypothetical protein QYM36_004572 [Artemia franciscana]|uniref:Uncharacterized protein n=1 Tax=Artemia franciscana TaxID=6661 RepID=A0AA88I306_ARTSF|nr:hypothetical protein QYM36_004572 [Artemia franciscana]